MSDNPDDRSTDREARTPTGAEFDPAQELPGAAPPPPPESAQEPATIERATPRPEKRRSSGIGGIPLVLAFVILAGAIAYVWYSGTRQDQLLQTQLADLQTRQAPTDVEGLGRRLAAVEARQTPSTQQTDDLAQRVATLEKRQQAAAPNASSGQSEPARQQAPNPGLAAPTQTAQQEAPPGPAPASPNLRALEQRVAALEQRASTADVATKADVTALGGRIDALASRQDQASGQYTATLAGFSGRLDAAEARVHENTQAIEQTKQSLSALAQKPDDQIAALRQQIASLGAETGNKLSVLDRTIDSIQSQVGALQKAASELPALTQRAAKIARIQAAQTALATGQPLGSIPDAPPALARFATTKPPTEAQLRLSFPAASRAAEEADNSLPDGATFLDRVRANAEGLFTVKRGGEVIVGNPASGILARAKQALDAGDLAGAVDGLSQLQGPAAQAMADWLDQARALLAARAALTQMAAKS